jgi:hypothetical protein
MADKFIFPRDLSEENQWMTFEISEIKKLGITQDPFELVNTTIKLPIPNSLKDNTIVNYNTPNLGAIAGQFVQNVRSGANGTDLLTGEIAAGLLGGAEAAYAAAQTVAVKRGAPRSVVKKLDEAVKVGIRGFGASTGLAINPFLTVMFERPNLRTHNFSWKLTPRSIQESESLLNIISAFKSAMLPGLVKGAGNVLLTYPYVLSIHFNNDMLNNMYMFKTSVIESFNIDYAASGSPSFFRAKTTKQQSPTTVSITLNLKEIEFNTREDFFAGRSTFGNKAIANLFNTPVTNNVPGYVPRTGYVPGTGATE